MRPIFALVAFTLVTLAPHQAHASAGQIDGEVAEFDIAAEFSPESFGADFGCVVAYQRLPQAASCFHGGGNDYVTLVTSVATGGTSLYKGGQDYTSCSQDEYLEITVKDYQDVFGHKHDVARLRTLLTGPVARAKGHVFFTGDIKRSAEGNLRGTEQELFDRILKTHPLCSSKSVPRPSIAAAGTPSARMSVADADAAIKAVRAPASAAVLAPHGQGPAGSNQPAY